MGGVLDGLAAVDYDYVPRTDVGEDDQLLHDGRFIAVMVGSTPVAEDVVEMLFDAIEADETAAEQLALSVDSATWLFAEKPVNYEADGDVLWA
jgi:hypothetical protein